MAPSSGGFRSLPALVSSSPPSRPLCRQGRERMTLSLTETKKDAHQILPHHSRTHTARDGGRMKHFKSKAREHFRANQSDLILELMLCLRTLVQTCYYLSPTEPCLVGTWPLLSDSSSEQSEIQCSAASKAQTLSQGIL